MGHHTAMKPTLPIAPWDFDPRPNNGDYHRVRPDIPQAIDGGSTAISPAQPSPITHLTHRVFHSRLNLTDMDYMAKALLQVSDENHELREMIRAQDQVIASILERLK